MKNYGTSLNNFRQDVEYTIDEHGITKAQVTVPYSDGRSYVFTYSVDSTVKDDAERMFYKVEIDDVPNNKMRRILGGTKHLMTYKVRKSCDVSCKHFSSKERKAMRVLDENLKGTHFEKDNAGGGYLYPTSQTDAKFRIDELEDLQPLIKLDETLRAQIVQKVIEIKESKMTEEERQKSYSARVEKAAEAARAILQAHKEDTENAANESGTLPTHETAHAQNHGMSAECGTVTWQRVKGKVHKLPPLDPTLDPSIWMEAAEQRKRANKQKAQEEATERTKAAYQKWLQENNKSPENK